MKRRVKYIIEIIQDLIKVINIKLHISYSTYLYISNLTYLSPHTIPLLSLQPLLSQAWGECNESLVSGRKGRFVI